MRRLTPAAREVAKSPAAALVALVAVVFLSIAIMVSAQLANAQNVVTGIASVIDGDTLEIHGQRIRLNGIDAPESGARCGTQNIYRQAANALADRIGGRTVACQISGQPDRYNRLVGRCSVAGEDLNTWLVREGWARDWPRYSRGRYAEAEAQARSAQRGIWSPTCPASMWGTRNYSR